MTQPSNK